MKRAVLVVLVVILVLVGISAIPAVYYLHFRPNDKVVPAFEEGKLILVVEGEQIISEHEPKILEGEVLLPFNVVKSYFDPNIYWDEALEKVTITTKDRVIRMKTDNLDAIVNNKPMALKIPVIKENEIVYIPIEFLSSFYSIEVSYIKQSNVIVIDYKNSLRQIAEPISPEAVIRRGRSMRYPIIRKLSLSAESSEENTLRIFEEYDKWYKVRTWDGAIGYIEKRFVVVKRMMVQEIPQEEKAEPGWKPQKGKINLVWDMVYSRRTDHSAVGEMKGLDVISPTWFQVKSADGELINRAYSKYVEWAHGNGYKVWALLSNDFRDYEMTSKFLNNTDSRDRLIKEILAYASLYKLDGINIDFENMYEKDKHAFTQFVRDITPFLKEQGLVVSVDVNDIKCYDKKALSEVVDYVMYMSYDQHWSTSPVAGSVAQVTWQEKILKRVLEEERVPREKLLLGLPFYTRLWQEETDANGRKNLTSKALSMEAARKTVLENNAEVRWDEESGQFYGQYQKDGSFFKIWLEDTNSINLKSSLVQKYKLAGACSWSRNFVSQEVWEVLNRNLKEIDSYQEWLTQNKDKRYVFK
ncbi:MAG: glycosyl hydrolase family 18 protein [Bacillota bacterium]